MDEKQYFKVISSEGNFQCDILSYTNEFLVVHDYNSSKIESNSEFLNSVVHSLLSKKCICCSMFDNSNLIIEIGECSITSKIKYKIINTEDIKSIELVNSH